MTEAPLREESGTSLSRHLREPRGDNLRGQTRLETLPKLSALEEDRHCQVLSLVPGTMGEGLQLRLLMVLQPLLSVCPYGTSPHKKGHGHSHTGFFYPLGHPDVTQRQMIRAEWGIPHQLWPRLGRGHFSSGLGWVRAISALA